MAMGKLYEAKVLGEAGNVNGEVSGGRMDFPHARVYIGEYVPPEPPKKIDRQPYKGTAAKVPGTIEAENFDEGNNGDSYEDTGNGDADEGSFAYRGSDYDVAVVDGGTGKAIGYTNENEWYEYTINVEQDGEYEIEANVSNGSGAGSLKLSLDKKDLASLSFTGTSNDWDTYEKTTGKATLTKGEHVLRVTIAAANTNVDYVKFSLPGSSSGDKPIAIVNDISIMNVDKDLQVFDALGKYLGLVRVSAGVSLNETLKVRFGKAGVYMVKTENSIQRIAVK